MPTTAGSDEEPTKPQRYDRDYRSPYSASASSTCGLRRRGRLVQEHPSPAFLLKAAKEAEKVRLDTERDVQRQMNW